MKKTIVAFVSLVWLFIVTFGSHAQTTVKLPAKAYPVKVPHKTDAGVDRYWHVTQILCLGPSSGGYKFRISVIFFPYHQYDVPASQQPGTDSRGLHLPGHHGRQIVQVRHRVGFQRLCTILVQRFLYP